MGGVVANFMRLPAVQKFWKSVKIWQSYREFKGGNFFWDTLYFLFVIVFGCQYWCNWLPGKTRLRNDLLCVTWNVKPYTLTHPPYSPSLPHLLLSTYLNITAPGTFSFSKNWHKLKTSIPWAVSHSFLENVYLCLLFRWGILSCKIVKVC